MIALSFGAGIQTTALLVLAVCGELPRPDVVIFADTGNEWPETYDYIARHSRPYAEGNGLRFEVVQSPHVPLYDYYWKYQSIPMPMNRSCTGNFKIRPLSKAYGLWSVTEEWIGYSLDEQGRASRKKRIRVKVAPRFPLIELGLLRGDCPAIIQEAGLPVPPKSACWLCPYQHPTRLWNLAQRHPDLFEKAALLEDRHIAKVGKSWYIHTKPWRSFAVPQPMLGGDDWDYGCADGYCLR